MQKDWQRRREVLRLGGAVSGWLELEQQLSRVSVPQPNSRVYMPRPQPNWMGPAVQTVENRFCPSVHLCSSVKLVLQL